MRVTITRHGETVAAGRANTADPLEAMQRVYNRTLRPRGTARECVALSERIADGVYRVQFGHDIPALQAASLGPVYIVQVSEAGTPSQ